MILLEKEKLSFPFLLCRCLSASKENKIKNKIGKGHLSKHKT